VVEGNLVGIGEILFVVLPKFDEVSVVRDHLVSGLSVALQLVPQVFLLAVSVALLLLDSEVSEPVMTLFQVILANVDCVQLDWLHRTLHRNNVNLTTQLSHFGCQH